MRRIILAGAAAALIAVAAPQRAGALAVTCTNCSTTMQQIKDSVMQAKQYALELKGWMDVANTYVTAVQNTAQLLPSAIAQVQGLYYRTAALGTAATALVGPEGSIMQRMHMLNAVGRGTSNLPSDTINSFEFWDQQRQRQMEENARLLGLEQERQAINDEMTKLAANNGSAADGQLRALQANNQATVAVAAQLSSLNTTMQQQLQYTMERDAANDAQERRAHAWMAGREYSHRPWIGN